MAAMRSAHHSSKGTKDVIANQLVAETVFAHSQFRILFHVLLAEVFFFYVPEETHNSYVPMHSVLTLQKRSLDNANLHAVSLLHCSHTCVSNISLPSFCMQFFTSIIVTTHYPCLNCLLRSTPRSAFQVYPNFRSKATLCRHRLASCIDEALHGIDVMCLVTDNEGSSKINTETKQKKIFWARTTTTDSL